MYIKEDEINEETKNLLETRETSLQTSILNMYYIS